MHHQQIHVKHGHFRFTELQQQTIESNHAKHNFWDSVRELFDWGKKSIFD